MKRRSVFVPVIPRGRRAGDETGTALCEVWAEPAAQGERPEDVPAADRRLAPVAAPLLKSALFESGCVAAAAVRKLAPPPPRMALYQRLRPHAWIETQRLNAFGAIPSSGNSAELGLALALLMRFSRADLGAVIATGALSGQPQVLHERDVSVRPVGGLKTKLRYVLDLARQGALPGQSEGKKALFFTPPTIEENGQDLCVLALPEIEDLAGYGITVIPVDRLGQAARALNAHRSTLLAADKILVAGIATLVIAAILFPAASTWRYMPVAITLEPGGIYAPQSDRPYERCHSMDGSSSYAVALQQGPQGAQIGEHRRLGWSVRIGTASSWDVVTFDFLQSSGYYLYFALIFETELELYDRPIGSDEPFRTAVGELWKHEVVMPSMDECGDDAVFVILAKRAPPLNVAAVKADVELRARLPSGRLDTNLVVHRLSDFVPGLVDFPVKLTKQSGPSDGGDSCAIQ